MNVTESVVKPVLDGVWRKSCSPPEVLRALPHALSPQAGPPSNSRQPMTGTPARVRCLTIGGGAVNHN
jgi:hypothetical protein